MIAVHIYGFISISASGTGKYYRKFSNQMVNGNSHCGCLCTVQSATSPTPAVQWNFMDCEFENFQFIHTIGIATKPIHSDGKNRIHSFYFIFHVLCSDFGVCIIVRLISNVSVQRAVRSNKITIIFGEGDFRSGAPTRSSCLTIWNFFHLQLNLGNVLPTYPSFVFYSSSSILLLLLYTYVPM